MIFSHLSVFWERGESPDEATDTVCVCVVGALVGKGWALSQLSFEQNTAVFNCTCAQRPVLSQY